MAKTMVSSGDSSLKSKLGCKRDSRSVLEASLVGARMIDGDGGEWSSMPSLHAEVVDRRWPSEQRSEEEKLGLFAIVG